MGLSTGGGQSAPASPDQQPAPISVRTNLVDLQVSVTDHKDHFVDGLEKNSFHISEDGREQDIAFFGRQDLPVAVGLVVDHSGSMGSKLPEVAAAAEAFAQSSNPQDDLFVVNFNEMVSLTLPPTTPFTSDQKALRQALVGPGAHGETALYDAVADAIDHLKLSHLQRQALIVVTDGGDNASKRTLSQVLDLAKASRAQIYGIGIYDNEDPDAKPGVLRKLTTLTGGEAYFPSSPAEVTAITQKIALNLRKEYLLGFTPNDSKEGWRTIRVVASAGEKLNVHSRTGYMFNDQPTTPGVSPVSSLGRP
jgi:Ca-activated chloride channel family protein